MPDWNTELRAAIAHLNLPPVREASVIEELTQHLKEQYSGLLADGMCEPDARRAVLEGLTEETFAESLGPITKAEPLPSKRTVFSGFTNDIRYATRLLLAKPAFTAVALLSIALGIGATTAMFSVVYAVLIDPYPYRAAERIGSVRTITKDNAMSMVGFSKAQYAEMKSRMRSMEDSIATSSNQVVMTGTGPAEMVEREECSPNFFDFLRVPPLLGRVFRSNSSTPEAVAVLSYKFWQQSFNGRPDILGQHLRLNSKLYTVIGVLPPRFTWEGEDAYVPMDMFPSKEDFVTAHFRTKPGVTQSQISAEFQPMIEEFRKQGPRLAFPEGAFKVTFVNLGILDTFANTLLALFGAVALLLLIGCANVANLLLARAATREGEMAIRLSMGATRQRLIRQLLSESLLIALTGGACGIGLAYAGVRAVTVLMPDYSIPGEAVIAVNWPVLCFAVATSLLTGMLFGVAPALQVSAETQAETLRRSARGSGASTTRQRLHHSLMIAEIALSLLLLTGAGLALRGLVAINSRTLGYQPQHALTFELPLSEGQYTQWATRLALFQSIVDRLRHSPQVSAAAVVAWGVPPKDGTDTQAILDDRPADQAPTVSLNLVQDGYFAAVGSKLLRGRDLSEADILQARPTVVISEDFAKRAFPANENPIGHHMQLALFQNQLPPVFLRPPQFTNSFEIVGIAETARNRGLNEPPVAAAFIPYSVLIPPATFIVARTFGDPNALTNTARNLVRAVDPNQPISDPRTLEALLNIETTYPKFNTFLFSVFGGIGLLLAVAGVFSVVSYAVAHRTREFGIRMALGAQPRDVLQLVLVGTGRVVLIGVFLGLALSIAASRILTTRMEGMGTADPLLFISVPGILITAALLACLWPALSATRIQPTQALHHD